MLGICLIYRRARISRELEGSLRYRRPLMLYLSGGELWSFAVFCAILSLTLSSWFFAGGAVACAVTGWQHCGCLAGPPAHVDE